MQQFDDAENRTAARRLRSIRQITEADEDTLQIVSSVLDRVLPSAAKGDRKKRTRTPRPEGEKGTSA